MAGDFILQNFSGRGIIILDISLSRKKCRLYNMHKYKLDLLCQKRSTGTFLRVSLHNRLRKGRGLVRAPRKCCRISSPLLRFFVYKEVSPSAEGDQMALPVGNPPPLKRWTKLLLLPFLCKFFHTNTLSASCYS